MKKIDVFLICFIGLFVIAMTYFDGYLELQSIYWLVGKLIGISIIVCGSIFSHYRKKETPLILFVLSTCFWGFPIAYFAYQDVAKYQRNVCQGKFGMEFNKLRQRLVVPEIPSNWHIDYSGRGYVGWAAKDTLIGHWQKYLSIDDSSCSIKYESDEYKLKPVGPVTRSLSIYTKYARGKGIDSIFYHFDLGHTTRFISRQQADSIFVAEKIKKDY